MKYLIKFEGHLKSTDPKALNSPLRNLGLKLKELLLYLQSVDNLGKSKSNNVRLFFEGQGQINVSYNFEGHNIFHCFIEDNHGQYIFNDTIKDEIILSIGFRKINSYDIKSEELYNSFLYSLKDYIVDGFDLKKSYSRFCFPVDKVDDIISKIKKNFDVRINMIKYNL